MKPIATTQLVNSILLLLLTSFIPFEGIGQQITFEKSYNYDLAEAAYCVQQTHDGGYILAGRQGVSIGTRNLMLIKTDSLGEVEWEKFYGEPGQEYVANSIQQTADSGYIVTGYKTVAGMGANVYLMKTDAKGDTLWTRNYGTTFSDRGNSVKQTYNGGYIIASRWRGDTACLIHTDAHGNMLWKKEYIPTEHQGSVAFSVVETPDSGFCMAGVSVSDSFSGEVYVVRTDKKGKALWSRNIGGPENERGQAIEVTNDDGFIVTGYTWSYGTGNYDVYLIKMDANGDTLWTQTYGDVNENTGRSVQQTSEGGFIIGGTTHSSTIGNSNYNLLLLKIDNQGKKEWLKELGGTQSDYGYKAIETVDRGYAICGLGDSYDNSPAAYLIKTDSIGSLVSGIPTNSTQGKVEVSVYPNPMLNKAQLEVMGINNHPITISIFDQQGRQVKQLNAQQARVIIDRGGLPSGLYLFRVTNSKGIIGTGKIIIQ